MSYRDDHEAALARIAALEAKLRERGEVMAPTTDPERERRIRELEQEVDRRESEKEWFAAEVRRVEHERDQIKAELDAIAHGSAARGLWTSWQHNRRFPPLERGEPAGVACPQCRAENVDTEMVREGGVSMVTGKDRWATFQYQSVVCPRCLMMTVLRTK